MADGSVMMTPSAGVLAVGDDAEQDARGVRRELIEMERDGSERASRMQHTAVKGCLIGFLALSLPRGFSTNGRLS